jgi:hypothetical protein
MTMKCAKSPREDKKELGAGTRIESFYIPIFNANVKPLDLALLSLSNKELFDS